MKPILELCEELKASVSLKKELAELAHDIARRDGISEAAVLEKISAAALLSAKNRRSEKLQELRWRLRKLRYPNLARAEEKFAAAKKKLCLPEAIHVHPSPFFEKKELRLEMKFRSPEELRQHLKKLNALAEEELKDLFL